MGEGSQRSQLEEQARNLGIRENITFTGKVRRQEISQHIAVSDICLLAGSNPFGSPIAMFEYMAMRKPVIVPDYGPITSIIEHNVDGYIFKSNEDNSLREGLNDLIDNASKRTRLAGNAYQKVIKNHRWIDNARRIVEIYERIK